MKTFLRIIAILGLSIITSSKSDTYHFFFFYICVYYAIFTICDIYQHIRKTDKVNRLEEICQRIEQSEIKNRKILKSIDQHLNKLNQIATAVYTEEEEEEDNSPTRISIN